MEQWKSKWFSEFSQGEESVSSFLPPSAIRPWGLMRLIPHAGSPTTEYTCWPIQIRPLQTSTNQPNYGRWRENTFEIEWNSEYHSLPLVARKAVMRNEEKLIGFDGRDRTNFNAKNLNRSFTFCSLCVVYSCVVYSYRFGIMPSSFTVQRRSPDHIDQFHVSRLYKKCIASIRREFVQDIDFLKLVLDAIDL